METQTETADCLFVVRLETSAGFTSIVESGLEILELAMTQSVDLDKDTSVFEAFFKTPEEAGICRAELARCLDEWAEGEPWSLQITRLPNRQWQDAWKEHFHTLRVSDRITIQPSWESHTPAPGECVIKLDPGMSFGTGQHFTTRFCLQAIDRLAALHPGATFCDLGCGSGILVIAAAQLGLTRLYAIDNDPVAVRIARENMVLNGVADRIQCEAGDLIQAAMPGPFKIVAANLVAPLLERFADSIVRWCDPSLPTYLILSGIMVPQYDRVKAAYEMQAFREESTVTEGDWRGGVFVRRGPT